MDKEQEKTLYRIGYVLILVCISIPLFAEYVMDNPSILNQLEWVENIVQHPGLCGEQIWFWIPVLLRCIGFTITASYRISMILAHMLSFGAVIWFGMRIFHEKKQVFILTALYLLNPIYLSFSYEQMCPDVLILWAVIPLVCGTVADLSRRVRRNRGERSLEKVKQNKTNGEKTSGRESLSYGIYVVSLILSVCLVIHFAGMAHDNISQRIPGYTLGQMFHTFSYEEGYPGMGIGIIAAVILLGWQRIAWNRNIEKKFWIYGVAAVFCMILASAFFAWQIPAVFLGCSMLPLSVLGTLGVTGFEEKDGGFLHLALPVILLITLVGAAVYLCNDLTYTHMPLFLKDGMIQ